MLKKILAGVLLFSLFHMVAYWLYLNDTSIVSVSYWFFDTCCNKSSSSNVHGFLKQLVQNLEGRNASFPAVVPAMKPTNATPTMAPCPAVSPLLVGPLRVEFDWKMTLADVRKMHMDLRNGGRYKPPDCVARQKVAVIVPFRNRHEHLQYWLEYIHPVLKRQQRDYGVYIINQYGREKFNRAKLFNVGYAEALKDYDYDCFVFSDVDLVPMDDRNVYGCFSQPRHLSVAIDKFKFKLPYIDNFGGVSSLSRLQFLKINGFPNGYWGWGGEDDDIANRLRYRGMHISRPDPEIGRYRMIQHLRDAHNEANPKRFIKINKTRATMDSDGINSLQYKVLKTKRDTLFTFITVDIGDSM